MSDFYFPFTYFFFQLEKTHTLSFVGFSMTELIFLLPILSSTQLAAPFLNLISNVEECSGGVLICLSGNTQEFAAMVPSIANGSTFSKADPGSGITVNYYL